DVTVGDGSGTDVLRLGASNQITDAVGVTTNSSGLFDLNGFSETITTLGMTGGSVTTGAGTLTLTSGITTNADPSTATISGNLNLNGVGTGWFVSDGAAAVDLQVDA